MLTKIHRIIFALYQFIKINIYKMAINIITKGGGSLVLKKTLAIDAEILKQTNKKNPKVLFIPTASSDDESYVTGFKLIFEKELNAHVDVLRVITENPDYATYSKQITEADAIYVGGGNTLKMMRRWRKLGIDKLLIDAANKGTVCSGTSAGMLCWYQYGHSDSMFYYTPDKWDYVRVKTLGVLPTMGCPHYDSEKRDVNFRKMVNKQKLIGLACDDCCAIHYLGDTYKVLTTSPNANAYKVYNTANGVVQVKLEKHESYRPVSELYQVL
jgi:dipeptidase E